jgi:hypothetical protein
MAMAIDTYTYNTGPDPNSPPIVTPPPLFFSTKSCTKRPKAVDED